MGTQVQHFDAVIVGSGFGGSVNAFRLAEAGRRVCVLERGKPYPPGSFARSPRELSKAFWDPSEGLHGIWNIWSFKGIEAMTSAGLGGGSLVYANVLLRKDERWFVKDDPFGAGYENWPISRADLEPHYDVAERMLGAQRFPFEAPVYRDTPKTKAMQEAAQRLGIDWQLPPLAVTFANPGDAPVRGEPIREEHPNLHGRTRLTCKMVGECDFGCNYGSKNSLDYNYLSAAKRHGADIRTRCEVREIAPRPGGGYTVTYVEHVPEREGVKTDTAKLPTISVTADRLVLAAGTLGTPYLLLRNRKALSGLSPALGTRFCGNGDLLTILSRAKSRIDGQVTNRRLDGSTGPVITSAMRIPDTVDGGEGRGFYIEDAGYPGFIDWMLEASTVPSTVRRAAAFAFRQVWGRVRRRPDSDLSAELGALLGDTSLSSGSMPLLGMGRDVPDGVMALRRRRLEIDWTTATSQEYFDRVRATMIDIAREVGADFSDNVLWRLKRVITVHPLGGAPMGRDVSEGVVDSNGEVFGHPGLTIADGSVMPGPVGPNPALTIAAFANRAADRILESGRTTASTQRENA